MNDDTLMFMWGYHLFGKREEDDEGEQNAIRYSITVKSENEKDFLNYASGRMEIVNQFMLGNEITYIVNMHRDEHISCDLIESILQF